MTKKPVIGISLDAEYNGGYSPMPWYALRQNYCDVIVNAGGVPLPLGHYLELVDDYAARIDGLLLTGGDFDIDPRLFGAKEVHETVKMKPARTNFEFAIAKKIYEQGKPILGICGGMQVLNVAFGGSLIQHIPDEVERCIAHQQPNPHQPAHNVAIEVGTQLHAITQVESAPVNTAHHQAVKIVAPPMKASAWAEDGVIECIESLNPNHFMVGVQWHPEYKVSQADTKIIDAFLKAAR
ncbi:gamma-glutamyl-gamma-aminobutyrate hydrolase family protein [Candidatus Paracaedibacter symbiosus]|uniref:gamma-glutamyl-gamma-aminobutyrate hydrolase family protein n=1 Tax=Candidatus Paracaedibacter symbiosus TaxID=244582 RepID=UPI0005095806|nr:gamma-glutamyl-gamma-aminobutyrate hydrolase family protein [Candidatus Paracaedibacter symbiosus]